MMSPVIAKFQLNYGDFQLEVDLQLPGQGISVLFGHSGSGKTTLLRCIAGLQQAPQGYLQINGVVWQDSAQGVFLPTHQRALGYVFQEANLFPHLTVAQNLQFGLKRLAKNSAKTALQPILELLGIEHLLQRMPEHLSGGERQRVAIARALVLDPEILLMDEPLAALDSKRKQEFMPHLQRLHQTLKIPVLYVTHAQQEVAQLADHLVVLEAGKVCTTGSLSETLSRLDLPLSKEKQATSVWQGQIAEHEAEYYLTRVNFDSTMLSLPRIDAKVGANIRIQILARDVSIVLEEPKYSSILNVLVANITNLSEDHSGQSIIQLQVGRQRLLAHITRKSSVLLNLKIGMTVFVQIKGTSIVN